MKIRQAVATPKRRDLAARYLSDLVETSRRNGSGTCG